MAASAGMQMIFGGTISRKSGLNQFVSLRNGPIFLKRDLSFRVRSMGEDDVEKEQTEVPIPTQLPTSPPKPKTTSTNISDILAFNGPGPERINGRLAMIGFVAAMGVEIANGQDMFSQIQGGGIPWFVGTSVLLSMASLIPLLRGVTPDSFSAGLMTSDAEMWNGRIAMLGLVGLAFTEFVKGGALI